MNDFVSTTFQIAFEFGYLPDVTYYVDNIVVTDKDAEPTVINLISNGDFESKAITLGELGVVERLRFRKKVKDMEVHIR